MKYILEHINEIIGILAAFGVVIEVTPIKLSPLRWIGNRLNKNTNEKIDKLEKRMDESEYKFAMKDLADVRNRIISYAILIKNGQRLDANTFTNIQHDLDMYDYYKETYKYMEISGRKVIINGEIATAREIISEAMKKMWFTHLFLL